MSEPIEDLNALPLFHACPHCGRLFSVEKDKTCAWCLLGYSDQEREMKTENIKHFIKKLGKDS